MYEFIGARYLDGVSKKTGHPFQSYIFCFLPTQSTGGQNEVGRFAMEKWVNIDVCDRLGGLAGCAKLIGSIVEPVLDLRGNLVDMRVIDQKSK